MLVVVLTLSAFVIVVVEIKDVLNWSWDKYGVSRNSFSALEKNRYDTLIERFLILSRPNMTLKLTILTFEIVKINLVFTEI